jgi:GTPase SAR1 family protein
MLSICVIGPPCSGKTSLVNRYINGTYIQKSNMTIEDTYVKTIKCENLERKVQITDTNGSEDYRLLLISEIQISNCVILCIPYNIFKFSQIKNFIDIIRCNEISNSIIEKNIILALTKSESVNEEIIRNDLDDEIRNICMENRIDAWIKTSSQNNIGIEQCFFKAFLYAENHFNKFILSNMNYELCSVNDKIFARSESIRLSKPSLRSNSSPDLRSLSYLYYKEEDILCRASSHSPKPSAITKDEKKEQDLSRVSSTGSPRSINSDVDDSIKNKRFSKKNLTFDDQNNKRESCINM